MSGSVAWTVLWLGVVSVSIACGLLLLWRSEHASLMKLLVGAWLVILSIAAAVVLTILPPPTGRRASYFNIFTMCLARLSAISLCLGTG